MKRYFREKNILVENTRKIMELSADEGSILIHQIEEFHKHCTDGMNIQTGYNPLLNELVTRGLFIKMINNEIIHKREIEGDVSYDYQTGFSLEQNMWIKEKSKFYMINFSYPNYYIKEYLIKKDEKGIYPELQSTIMIYGMLEKNYNSIIESSIENPLDNPKTKEIMDEGKSLYRFKKVKRYVRDNEVFEEEFIRHAINEPEENKNIGSETPR